MGNRMSRSIRSYIPDEDYTDFIACKISPRLKERVDAIARRNKWTTSAVIRAGLQKFVDDEDSEYRAPEKYRMPRQMDFLAEK